ncbi:hypothetical protein C1646_663639, partial [Rhizophagus diaphanus]
VTSFGIWIRNWTPRTPTRMNQTLRRSASWNGLVSPYRSFRILDDMIGISFVLASDSRYLLDEFYAKVKRYLLDEFYEPLALQIKILYSAELPARTNRTLRSPALEFGYETGLQGRK